MYLNLRQRLSAIPTLFVVPGYAFVHGTLAFAGMAVLLDPRLRAPFWPASGLLVGILLLEPVRRWPAWIGAALLGHGVVAALPYQGATNVLLAFAFAGFSTLSAPIAAFTVRGLLRDRRLEDHLLVALGATALAALLVPLLPGYLSARLSSLLGSETPFLLILRTWWAAEALGIFTVAPLIVAWGVGPSLEWLESRWRLTEVIGVALSLLVVTHLVCAQPSGMSYMILFVVPFFVWLGLRADAPIVSATGLLSLAIAIYHTSQGSGPFVAGPLSDEFSALGLHVLYGSLLGSGLVTSYLVQHQRVLNRRYAMAELVLELFTNLADAAPEELLPRIEQALETVGQFTRAARAKLLLFKDGVIHVFASWSQPDATDTTERLDGQPVTDFPWTMGELTAGRDVNFDRHTATGNADAAERARYADLETAAVQAVPLFEAEELAGAVTLAWVKRQPHDTSDRTALLPVAAKLFASGLRRDRVQREIQAYQDSLRMLASELSLAEERVRRATAVDLHDTIAQSLAVARIKVGRLLQEQPSETLNQLGAMLEEAIGHTRHLIADLSPPVLYELGLSEAMHWLVDREQMRGSFRPEIVETGAPDELPEAAKVALFQCFRELLTNVIKHAQAASVHVGLHWLEDAVEITVQDDGVGFRTSEKLGLTPVGGHLGLFTVRERVQSLGGHFAVESTRGAGTRARVSVPFRRQQIAV